MFPFQKSLPSGKKIRAMLLLSSQAHVALSLPGGKLMQQENSWRSIKS